MNLFTSKAPTDGGPPPFAPEDAAHVSSLLVSWRVIVYSVIAILLLGLADVLMLATSETETEAPHPLISTLALPAEAAFLFGWWRLSAPGGRVEGGPRRTLRVALIAAAAFVALSTAWDALIGRETVSEVIETVSLIVVALLIYTALAYLRWLSHRLESPSLRRRAQITLSVMRVTLLLATLSLVLLLLAVLVNASVVSDVLIWTAVGAGYAAGLGALGAVIFLLVTLDALGRAIKGMLRRLDPADSQPA